MLPHKFNFDNFYRQYKKLYPTKSLPCSVFLTWFLGFAEGDGSFYVIKNGRLVFELGQSSYDKQVIERIASNLNFGKIHTTKNAAKTTKFSVQDQIGTSLLISLFNGNMVLPTKQNSLLVCIAGHNHSVLKPRKIKSIRTLSIVKPSNNTVLPTLEDAWIAGFTDAEGCFHVSFKKSGGFLICYQLSQKHTANKGILKHIRNLFGQGVIVGHSNDNWVLKIASLPRCSAVFPYFEKFTLLSKKALSYEKWKVIYQAIKEGLHLIPFERDKLILLSKDVNPNIDRSLLSYAKPSGAGRPKKLPPIKVVKK